MTSGRPPFGHGYQGKAAGSRGQWVIVPEQGVFKLAEEGRSPREIALLLDAEGVRTITGVRWYKEVVGTILRNISYCGEGRFHRRYSCEPDESRRRKPPQPGKSKKTSLRLRVRSEWIMVKIPAIITREESDRVRAIPEQGAALAVIPPVQLG